MAEQLTTTDPSKEQGRHRRAYRTGPHRRRGIPLGRRIGALAFSLVLVLASLPLTAGVTAAATSQPTWTQLSPGTSPPARAGASIAFDPATGQLILFGGEDGSIFLNDTWTWSGSTWTKLSPSTSPPAREYASIAFDPATGQLLLFGGNYSDYLGDTWAWDGTTWTQLHPGTSPSARDNATMAFDPATGQLLLFGGGNRNILGDTWTWDGTTWTQLSPGTSPSARWAASMAFDPATGQLLLFGGLNQSSSNLNDTWTWDGTTWTQLSPSTSPSARHGSSLAFDPATGQLILFGGEDSSYSILNDTWAWDGSTWTQLSLSTSPQAHAFASMAFDPATGQLLLFGGFNDIFNGSLLNDTWVYAVPSFFTDWSQLSPGTSPSARYHASMAFDPATGQLILFGGYGDSGRLNDTWAWDGSTWTKLSPATSPSARYRASMAFDPATGQLLLFGGDDGSYLNDTWAWDGSTWTKLSPGTSPSGRRSASLAFDPATGQLILFGGQAGLSYLNDTWAWNGSTWTKLSPGTSPSGRRSASLAFNPATGQIILFGGFGYSGWLNDTWSWDGNTWTKLSPSTSPSGGEDASMAFDPATGQLLLFGGWNGRSAFNDTWTWNGATWTKLRPNTSPPARDSASMAFDPATGQFILFAGLSSGFLNDTWELVLISDTTPPTTTASATNADNSTYTFGDWTTQSVTVTLSVADNAGGSGVASTYYTVDGGSQQTYSSPFSVTGDGDHIVTYWSTDNVGNTESSHTVHVMIDTTAPSTSASATNADNSTYTFGTWSNQNVTVTLSASDTGGSGIANTFYKVDAGSQQTYSSPFSVTGDGDHTITYWSTDNVGNTETTHTVHVMIDQTAPTISGSASPAPNANGWNNTDVTVSFTCNDALSGIATCSSSTTLTAEGAGQSVTGTATDKAGNSASTTVSINIDKTAPMVTYSGNQGSYTVDQTVTITCSASDALSGVASTTCADITGPAYSFTLGVNTFSATATDYAGNVGSGSTSFVVEVTPDSLINLTNQFVSNRRAASQLTSPLTGVKWADAMHNTRLKASFVNSYILLVQAQSGLSNQQKTILIQLARAL